MVYNMLIGLLILLLFSIHIIGLEYRNSNQNEDNKMSDKKETFFESLAKGMALLVGIGLVVEIIKMLGKKVYTCPNCNNVIEYHKTPCPHCKTNLIWKI